ncbi:MAG: TetR/AcrR family transcriptional regulator [Candidatus Fimenecus sp.]
MKQEQKTQISKEQIIKTAISEFSAYGYSAASINRICQNGGISKGRLYHHYDGKAEIYFKAVAYCYQEFAKHMRQFEIDHEADFEQNLVSLYQLFRRFWEENPEMLNLFIESRTLPPPELREELMQVRAQFFNESVKEKLREIVLFHFPQDEQQQRVLVALFFTAIDYITTSIGTPEISPQTNLTGFIDAQNELFRTAIHIFLYGCLNR